MIRTRDPLDPNQVRYQAALRSGPAKADLSTFSPARAQGKKALRQTSPARCMRAGKCSGDTFRSRISRSRAKKYARQPVLAGSLEEEHSSCRCARIIAERPQLFRFCCFTLYFNRQIKSERHGRARLISFARTSDAHVG